MFDLLGIILPKRCVFCRKVCIDGICDDCRGCLPWRAVTPPVAPLYYRDTVRLALHRYKFNGAAGYSVVFAELMAARVKDCGINASLVTWVPCSFFRRWSRGYDQSEKLARAVAGILGVPAKKLIIKKRHAKSQTKMADESARRENVRGVFSVCGDVSGLRVLLVDDIYTSGATMEECRGILLKAGAAEVCGCVLAAKK